MKKADCRSASRAERQRTSGAHRRARRERPHSRGPGPEDRARGRARGLKDKTNSPRHGISSAGAKYRAELSTAQGRSHEKRRARADQPLHRRDAQHRGSGRARAPWTGQHAEAMLARVSSTASGPPPWRVQEYIEKDKALERRFPAVVVDPPTVEDTYPSARPQGALRGAPLRQDTGQRTGGGAAVLTNRYISDRFLLTRPRPRGRGGAHDPDRDRLQPAELDGITRKDHAARTRRLRSRRRRQCQQEPARGATRNADLMEQAKAMLTRWEKERKEIQA
jgi:hypothetical protein